MKRLTFFLLFMSISLQCLSGAAARDFYGNTKYPGPKARPDVGLYEVTQPDNVDPQKYTAREVDWFPRKGLDFVPLEEDMPLRTWTFRSDGPRLAYDQPEQLEAHLIGFRGIGNTVSNPFIGDGGPLEPAIILRLADGRKRCFIRGTFCEEDKAYIMGLWLKEMDRIKATLDKTERPVKKFNNAEFGKPGSAYLETEHFRWYCGTQQGSDDDHWSNEGDPAKARIYRDGALAAAE